MLLHINKIKLATLGACLEYIIDEGHTPLIAVDTRNPDYRGPSKGINDAGLIILNVSGTAVANYFADDEGISFGYASDGKRGAAYLPMEAIVTVFARENNTIIQSFPYIKVDTETEPVKVTTKPKKKGFQPRIIPGGKA